MRHFKTVMLISVINLAALIAVTFKMPDMVPIHVNLYGVVDRYGPRWTIVLFGLIAPVLIATMMIYRSQTKLNEKAQKNRRVEDIVLPIIALILAAMPWLSVAMACAGENRLPYELIVVMPLGILMIILGNYMGVIRQNRWFGIRTKWTLANEEVWRRTHRTSAYLSVAGGIVMVAGAVLSYLTGNRHIVFAALIVGIFMTVLYPIIYSYVVYRKIEK